MSSSRSGLILTLLATVVVIIGLGVGFHQSAASITYVLAIALIVTGAFLALIRDRARLRRTELELRAREQKFTTLSKSAPVGLVQCDASGQVTYVNERWCQLAGISAARALKEGWTESVHPEDRDAILNEWRNWAKNPGARDFVAELRFQRTDGSVTHVRCNAAPLLSADGSAEGYISTVTDITPIRQAQQEVERLTAIQQAILKGAGMAMVATDRSGTITAFNRAAEALLGYSAEELVGRQTPAVFHDLEEVSERACAISRQLGREVQPGFDVFVALTHDQPIDRNEWTYIRKDGTRVPVDLSVSAIRDSDGVVIGYIGVATDISERLRTERDLRFSEARHRAIVDNILDGIITVDSTGVIQSLNPAAEHLFCYSAAELSGRPIQALLPPQDLPLFETQVRTYRDEKARISGIAREGEGLRKDGTVFPLGLSVSEVDFNGERLFIAVIKDISERRKIDRMKSDFVSTVSHELRTPLTAIRGSLSLVNSGVVGEVPEDVLELTVVAEQSTERLVRLINDILDIEKLGSGELKLDLKPLTMSEVIDRAIVDNRAYGDQFRVGLRAGNRADNAQVMADFDRLVQVLTNLISNAVKFSPAEAEVVIHSEFSGRDNVRVSVVDRGMGIPKEFQSRIFGKFAQADSSDSKAKGGTGLGLSISRDLVERMGGRIWFETAAGKGTTFFVELPLSMCSLESHENDRRPAVLVVEDILETSRHLVAVLDGAGFATSVARTAGEAIQQLAERSFVAMTLDLRLPDANGASILSTLRDRPETQGLPVIVVSAVAEEAKRTLLGQSPEVIEWIGKPVSDSRLLAAVQCAMQARGEGIRILHVEDDANTRSLVSRLLAGYAEVVAAGTLAEGIGIAQRQSFDLAIVDIGLADGNGLDLATSLRDARGLLPPIVVFSAQDMLPAGSEGSVSAALVKSRASNRDITETIRNLIPSRGVSSDVSVEAR